jgi:hypothetical protein
MGKGLALLELEPLRGRVAFIHPAAGKRNCSESPDKL